MRKAYEIWFENLKGRDHLEDLGVTGSKILKIMRVWSGII
jgi:hypothetical protein